MGSYLETNRTSCAVVRLVNAHVYAELVTNFFDSSKALGANWGNVMDEDGVAGEVLPRRVDCICIFDTLLTIAELPAMEP